MDSNDFLSSTLTALLCNKIAMELRNPSIFCSACFGPISVHLNCAACCLSDGSESQFASWAIIIATITSLRTTKSTTSHMVHAVSPSQSKVVLILIVLYCYAPNNTISINMTLDCDGHTSCQTVQRGPNPNHRGYVSF